MSSANIICNNLFWLFLCSYFISTEIDECQENNECHARATCSDLFLSYNCTCDDGFEGDGFLCTGECYK